MSFFLSSLILLGTLSSVVYGSVSAAVVDNPLKVDEFHHPKYPNDGRMELQLNLCQLPHPSLQQSSQVEFTACDPSSTTMDSIGLITLSISTKLDYNNEVAFGNTSMIVNSVNQWVLNNLIKSSITWDDDSEEIPHPSSHRRAVEYYYYASGNHDQQQQQQQDGEDRDNTILINTSLAILCICVAGLGAGLTIGMLSIEPLSLMIKIRCGSPTEALQAKLLLPIILKRHRLLVTLLLINSLANEALPLFLDKVVPSHIAVLISVTAVLIFGEILPTAIFTGPNQISLAAYMCPLVTVLMALLCPIAWPIAKVLDRFMKHEDSSSSISKAYAREEISALVRIMYEEQKRERQTMLNSLLSVGGGGGEDGHHSSRTTSASKKSTGSNTFLSMKPFSIITKKTTKGEDNKDTSEEEEEVDEQCIVSKPSSFAIDEVAMVEGALQLKTKTANDIYTPLSKVSAIENDIILDEDTIATIYACGHSRIPVYQPRYDSDGRKTDDISSITAILLTRQLMVVDSDDRRKVSSLPLFEPICVGTDISLIDLLNVFKHRGGGHHTTTTAVATTNSNSNNKETISTKNYGRASHLAVVCMNPDLANQSLDKGLPIPREACVLGIVTLEDIIEQLVQESIVDEYDREELRAEQRARNAFQKWKGFATKKKLLAETGSGETTNGLLL